MKIALVTEGTYPITTGGVSTWCDHLIRGLPEHQFSIVALGPYGTEKVVWDWPENVEGASIHGVWAELPPRRERISARSDVPELDDVLLRLWGAVLDDRPGGAHAVSRSLRELVELSDRVSLAAALAARGSEHALSSVWLQHVHDQGWPPLAVAEAIQAAAVVDRVLSLIDVRLPEADLTHVTANGPCGLVGLVGRWRSGTPILVSEHGIYIREQYLALRASKLGWGVRRAITAFTRGLSTAVFAESELIAPVNRFNGRWERELGARDEQIMPIMNGVSPDVYTPVFDEPDEPTVSFVGRIDPLKDLATLITAHAHVVKRIPNARLRLFGPVPNGNEAYRDELADLITELGIQENVSWEGSVKNSRIAIAAGHVVALSSISEGMPYSVLESMMCGRPTVSTDVGGVFECFDGDRGAGVVVPPRNPEAMAEALIALLIDEDSRLDMGVRAAVLARERFTLEGFIDAYRSTYRDVVDNAAITDATVPRVDVARVRTGPIDVDTVERIVFPAGRTVEPAALLLEVS